MIAAVVRGGVEEVRMRVEDGTDLGKTEGLYGTTPLMAACAPTEKLPVLEYLLGLPRGVRPDLDTPNAKGMTALHQAAWYGQAGAVRLLLNGGADRAATTPDGQTAEEMARSMGHEEAHAALTCKYEPPPETPDELRERLRQQHRANSQRRLLSARKALMELPPPPPLTVLPPSPDKAPKAAPTLPPPADNATSPPKAAKSPPKSPQKPQPASPPKALAQRGEDRRAAAEAKSGEVSPQKSQISPFASRTESGAGGGGERRPADPGEGAFAARAAGGGLAQRCRDVEGELARAAEALSRLPPIPPKPEEGGEGGGERSESARGCRPEEGAGSFFITQEGSMGQRIGGLLGKGGGEGGGGGKGVGGGRPWSALPDARTGRAGVR